MDVIPSCAECAFFISDGPGRKGWGFCSEPKNLDLPKWYFDFNVRSDDSCERFSSQEASK